MLRSWEEKRSEARPERALKPKIPHFLSSQNSFTGERQWDQTPD
jgi:hypothetical protein